MTSKQEDREKRAKELAKMTTVEPVDVAIKQWNRIITLVEARSEDKIKTQKLVEVSTSRQTEIKRLKKECEQLDAYTNLLHGDIKWLKKKLDVATQRLFITGGALAVVCSLCFMALVLFELGVLHG